MKRLIMVVLICFSPLTLAHKLAPSLLEITEPSAGEYQVLWRTPAGKRVRIRSSRMVSFHQRHLVVLTFEVTMLDDHAPVAISSQIPNRQDGEDEAPQGPAARQDERAHVGQRRGGEGEREGHQPPPPTNRPRGSKACRRPAVRAATPGASGSCVPRATCVASEARTRVACPT